MKIALVNSEYPSITGIDHGGIATYTYTLANFLTAAGHTVHVLSRSGVHSEELHPSVQVHHIQMYRGKDLTSRLLSHISSSDISWEKELAHGVRNCLLEIKALDGLDIVEYPEYGGLGMYCGNISGVASVVTLHTPSELVDQLNERQAANPRRSIYKMEKKSILAADICKCPSEALRQYAIDRYSLNKDKITLLRNPFDISEMRNMFHAKDENSGARFDILFSGRLEYRKGAEIVTRSIPDILSIHRNITITIAGETDITGHQNYRVAIERLVNREDRTRIWFPGPTPHKKLLPLYKNSSLFLFPSLYENAPYALLEAMACGLPVVAANTGGIKELITHGETGMLFSPTDVSEPVASIKRIFENRELGECLGRSAAAFIAEKYDPAGTIDDYITFYTSVKNGATPPHEYSLHLQ